MRPANWQLTLSFCVALTLTMVGCRAQVPPPTGPELDVAQTQWPGATLTSLRSGRELYVQHCAGCHDLVRPEEHPPIRWLTLVRSMRTEEGVDLSDVDATLIERYLYSASAVTRGVDSGPAQR